MSDEHVCWEEWEPGDALDEQHLRDCPDCRVEWRARLFLKFSTEAAPRMEAPPFFAVRVARRAAGEVGAPFWVFLETAARRLIPAFAALLLATTFLLQRSIQTEPAASAELELLVEPLDAEAPTLDEMVVFLRQPDGEDEEN